MKVVGIDSISHGITFKRTNDVLSSPIPSFKSKEGNYTHQINCLVHCYAGELLELTNTSCLHCLCHGAN